MSPALTDVLLELLELSRTRSGAHVRLSSGLHVQAQTRGERQRLMCWRTRSKLPGRTECAVLARDAGFLLPRYREWALSDGTPAFVISDAAQGFELCDHTWGMQVHGDGRNELFYASTCTLCGARWRQVMARRGKRVEHSYNGDVVTEEAWKVLLKRGPKPDPSQELTTDEQALARLDAAMVRPAPIVPVAPSEKELREAEEAERERLLQAAKNRHVRHLLLLARLRGLRDPWFRRESVLEAREAYLKRASLAELREERRSTFARVQLALGLPDLLAICRWRHAHRALSIRVTQGGVGCPCQDGTPDDLPDPRCPDCNGAGLQFGDPMPDQPGLFGGAP